MEDLDYASLDPNIAPLVKALNSFRGVQTIGSCGGHAEPKGGQWEEGTWYVKFEVAKTEEGCYALEFLAWIVNCDGKRAGTPVYLYPYAPPPQLNPPGELLSYCLEGYEGHNPLQYAEFLAYSKDMLFAEPGHVNCVEHGMHPITYICQHLRQSLANPGERIGFFESDSDDEPPERHAWCSKCDAVLEAEGSEWTDKAAEFADPSEVCEKCFEELKLRN